MPKNIFISKGRPCPKCSTEMHIKGHKGFTKTRAEKGGYYFSQWEYCRNCAYVLLEEKYKCLFSDLPPEMINQYESVQNPAGSKKRRKEERRFAMLEARKNRPKKIKKPKKQKKKKGRILIIQQTYKERHTEYINSIYWARRKEDWYSTHTKACYACTSLLNIHLHHLDYSRMGFERDEDLVALCSSCHNELHERYGTKDLINNTWRFITEKREKTDIPCDFEII